MTEYPFHPMAGLFPLIDGAEFNELAADIAAHGQREPIVLYNGAILDGRNRYAACLSVGVEPRFTEYDGDDPLAFVLSLNLHRRHLSQSQKAALALDILPMAEAEAKKRYSATVGRPASPQIGYTNTPDCDEPRRARDDVARLVGVSPSYVASAKAVALAAPDLMDDIRRGDMTVTEAKREVRTRQREERRSELVALASMAEASERYELHRQDVAGGSDVVADGSLDFIVTDPPYPREFLGVYADLAAFARRALRPGGSLLVMIGQSYLPDIIASLGAELSYQWTIGYLTPGGQAVQLWDRKVNTFWKPVLWYVNGDYPGAWVGDVVRSDTNDNDKRFHHWGQSGSGMLDLMRRFVREGDVVCDPFCGGGTTGVVALELGARFVGLDIDGDALTVARGRLAEAIA